MGCEQRSGVTTSCMVTFLRPMKRSLIILALALLLSSAVLSAACGGSSEQKDLTSTYDTFAVFPGSTIDGIGAAPATLVKGNIKTFKNDRRMFIASSDATEEQVLAYFSKELPKSGWKKEDPPKPKAKDMKGYCPISYVTCLSFTKGDIRMIVSSTLQLQLNPLSTQGVSYHIHLESR